MEFDLSPLWISLKTAFVATIFAFFAGILAARWMLGYRGKGRGIIDGIFTLPLVLPPTVAGFLLLLLFGRNSPVGQVLMQLGINIIFTWQATVIASSVVAFPLMYKTVLGAFEQIDPDYLNCARTLGASEWRLFWQVILPLAWPGVVAGTILAFARALGEFGATLMIAGSIPGITQTIPIAIFFAAESGKMDLALNWVLLMVAISLFAIAAINSWSDKHNPQKSQGQTSTFTKRLMNFLIFGHQDMVLPQIVTASYGRSPIRSQSELLVNNLVCQLPDFSLEVAFNADRTLGLLGASGSGKSMTLRCIAGLQTPTRGRIVLNGRVLFDSQRGINFPTRKRRIGFLFQNYALFPHLTVAQNIAFGLQDLHGKQRLEQVAKYVQMMQLQGLSDRYPHQLSGGQQQRVALARAMAVSPEVLLLDEPLSALDTYLRTQIERLLIQVLSNYEGVTLFITHKLEEAYRICNNLLVLSEGKIIAQGHKTEIFERPANLTVAQITECKNFSSAQAINSQQVAAVNWDCTLRVIEHIPTLTYIGIRAHHITFADRPDGENTFPCWVVESSETQHRITLYLRLHSPPRDFEEHHLQVEVYKEKWADLKDRPEPWYVYLDPLRLILMPS